MGTALLPSAENVSQPHSVLGDCSSASFAPSMYLTELFVREIDGSAVGFSRVSPRACESIPSRTYIVVNDFVRGLSSLGV